MSTESNYPAPKPTREGYGPPAAAPVPPDPYGSPQQQPVYAGHQQQPPLNTLAVISFVSAFFVSLVAVVLGHLALGRIKRTGERGRGLAIAGLVLGYAGCIIGAVMIITMLAAYNASY